jgi:thioredoxin reductase (NADPH)
MPAVETDALVIGAGPAGLFQAFQLGLQGIHCQVVDALPQAGGQCHALYPDKPIYDIPALPRVTGQELTARLLEQLQPFAPGFHFEQEVTALRPGPNRPGVWEVRTTAGQVFFSKTVFIAAGVGAFVPRALKLDGLSDLAEQHLHMGADHTATDFADRFAGMACVVVGCDAQAVGTAVALAQAFASATHPKSVTLVHRKDEFEAPASLQQALASLRASGHLQVVLGQPIGMQDQQLVVAKDDDTEQRLPLDDLWVCLGLSPRLGALTDWGLSMHKRQITVDPAQMVTNLPGIYAIGDINDYPGKRKLIVSAFHEATLAAFAAAARVFPEQMVRLEYTTTSRLLQSRLGV